MASYNELIALIDAFIKRNGVQAITGQILNGVLKAMVDQVGRGYAIMGVATPSTNPGTPDAPESWFASTPGTYTNFGGLEVADAEFALLSYTPSGEVWTKTTLTEGIQEVSASIDGNVGTPEVTAEYINGGLIFTFSNMKGQTGDAAGFGTVNATVDGNIGTPGVSVNTSGPDTAKNITFAFRNLKGETGVTSVVATVDNTSGTPSCAVSLVGQELHLDFHGLKGAQGDTGSSVDYPFTIVNNLTTDDPTQALSAAQGVVLQGELSQLEAKIGEYGEDIVIDNFADVRTGGGFISSTSPYPWSYLSNGATIGKVADVSQYRGRTIKIKRVAGYDFRYAFLKDANYVQNTPANFCDGTSLYIIPSSDATLEYEHIVPSDCNFVYVLTKINNVDVTPTVKVSGDGETLDTESQTLIGAINEVNQKVEDLIQFSEEDAPVLGFTDVRTGGGFISSSSPYPWSYLGDASTIGKVSDISQYVGKAITIVKQSGKAFRYAFLKNANFVLDAVPAFCDGTSLNVLSASSPDTIVGTIPSDCNFLYVSTKLSGVDVTPTVSVKIDSDVYDLTLVPGVISNGRIVGPVSDDTQMKRNRISEQIIWLGKNAKIKSVSDAGYTIFCYGKDLSYIGETTTLDLPDDTFAIRLMVTSASDYTFAYLVTKIGVQTTEDVRFVKDDGAKDNPIFMSFGVSIPDDIYPADDNYSGQNGTTAYTNGYIILPRNYTRDGTPTKLIVFCHGTDGYDFGEGAIKVYEQQLKFLAKNGYAVVDCCTTTNRYKTIMDVDFACPQSFACYKALYETVCRRFNIDKSGCYVFGKSAGGKVAIMLAHLQLFPVRAVASLAGTIDSYTEMRVYGTGIVGTNWGLSQLGFVNPQLSPNLSGSGDKQYLLDNIDKMVGYNAMWFGTIGLDKDAFTDRVLTITFPGGFLDDPICEELVSESCNTLKTPLKIFHATDDANVPYATSKWYVQMIKAGGGIAELRTIGPNVGKHNAVDTAPNAPQVNYTTKLGDTVQIVVTYAELVDWFSCW